MRSIYSVRAAAVLLMLSGSAGLLRAQDEYARHNVTLGIGGAAPTGDIKSFMKASPMLNVSYGYRFHRYFQADLGLNMIFGAANIHDFVNTDLGGTNLKDREYMLPFGGRVVAPLFRGRLLLGAGGGGVYLRYSESINQLDYSYQVACPVCTARSGWGGYGLANASYFLDSDRHFRVGVTTQFIRAHTNGDALGNLPGVGTSDRWVNVLGEVGFSF